MKNIFIILAMTLAFPIVTFAGWEQDVNGWKYKETGGEYKTGWYQDVDDRWYYLDNDTGYMLMDATTPDGFYVSPSGEWVKEVNTETAEKDYENKVEVAISALDESSKNVTSIGYEIPVTVYYNNEYKNIIDGMIAINGIEVSKNGVAYVQTTVRDKERGMRVGLDELVKYTLDDGTVVEEKNALIASLAKQANLDINAELIGGMGVDRILKKQKIISVEVYIVEAVE